MQHQVDSEGFVATAATPAWLLSLTLHILLLILISLLTYSIPNPFELTLSMADVEPIEEVPQEFHFQEDPSENLGALSDDGKSVAMAAAPVLADLAEIASQPQHDPLDVGQIEFIEQTDFVSTPLETSKRLVRGVAGVGVTGASGAIDRLTHEILLSLEDRDTLVVWLFDQSGSLNRQRREINARLQRIYEELGIAFDQIDDPTSNRQPLLTAVMGFGEKPTWYLRKPSADTDAIQAAVASIPTDESGIENVFGSIYVAAEEFQNWRNKRNIMLIAVTDEAGDDYHAMLEKTVKICRKNAMPVYVIGVPAAFGEQETMLKWVDPNPKYDQTPKWGRVNQGPESLRLERLQLPFANGNDAILDSGFGPFALTRLCYQTGGIYFAIHPNRKLGRRIRRGETEAFSSHFSYFFDSQRMRVYRPEYVSVQEYDKQAAASSARTALLRAAQIRLDRMSQPRTRFVNLNEADFSNALTESQKAAAKLEPKVNAIYTILKQGEEDRQDEESLRWQAAYDLAFGQTLAVLVRTRGYNEMLAMAKRGLKPEKETTNTWELVPDETLTTSSRLEREAERALEYLERVAQEHEGTPWALIAKRELAVPLGWRWKESHTPPPPQRNVAANNNNNPQMPRDDKKRMLPPRPPARSVPKL